MVFSSSCATYGIPERLPIPENHPQHPINPYGSSKLFVERMLADLNVACDISMLQGLRIGEAHNPETHLIPLALEAARTGTPVRILGTDYDTPDGTCVRDCIHVADIANAHVRALEYLLAGAKSCAVNLANARGYSVKEVLAAAEAVCGNRVQAEIAPRRPGDPAVLVGDASRARAILHWEPMRPGLQMQIADAWRWMKWH
jgi:UDP-glucose 4-epimerase